MGVYAFKNYQTKFFLHLKNHVIPVHGPPLEITDQLIEKVKKNTNSLMFQHYNNMLLKLHIRQ